MAKSKGSALAIIAFVIGAGGLGIGIYMMITSNNAPDIVAVWEDITASGTSLDFYLNVSNNQLPQNDYYSLTNGNTNITLTHTGWYKFTIQTLWGSLSSVTAYYLAAEKNGIEKSYLAYYYHPADSYQSINLVHHVYSDGDDTICFHCYTFGSQPFYLGTGQNYNQVVLEYVETI